MAAVRKSAVSAPNPWFWQNSKPTAPRRRSPGNGSAMSSASPLPDQSPVASPKRRRRAAKSLSAPATKGLQEFTPSKVSHVPTAEVLPSWLLRLYTVHRYSSVVTFLLVAVALVVYGWTVYSQELWNQEFRRLQNLQRNERQLTTTNAMLKNKMAEDAENPSAGLVSPTPDKTIFLPSASDSASSLPSNKTSNSPIQQPTSSPLGY
ncbi:hypothetical protein NIES2109_08060 [Nostoc sp. HK-01]|uniref:Cell division protein FtsL n=2 Tax=Nostocales TaxID=1161 RepID=A0A1Z4GL49_9CYAN|nr:hypothetical protein [Nostoc cycadae]BAY18230.1 hypothetical protein NIES21_40740 [Anabaenopsis circularis NIES-21]BBD58037.1 hypothetical protein NIES2109_08060 [Nostoc sp. HK-01]